VDTPDVFEDLDPDPDVFEANLTARESNLRMGDEIVTMLSYGGRVPGPEIRVKQWDRVVIHLENQLPTGFDTSIHWHGIEGTNAMDGTPVSQDPIAVGDTFTYDFIAPRPGVYWYHPHVRGAQSVYSGLYAPLIVEDPDEAILQGMGILPENELTLVLSDTDWFDGNVKSVEGDDASEIMNGIEGKVLLVNGQDLPRFEVPAGDGLRLRIINASITRFYRLRVPGHTLYRIGGEGGLLDRVRIEGGTVTGRVESADGTFLREEPVSLGHDRGEILLGAAERVDVVLVPDGEPGDELVLEWKDYARGRHEHVMEGDEMAMVDASDDGQRPSKDIATFELVAGSGTGFSIDEGDPVLEAIGRTLSPVDPIGARDFTGEAATQLFSRMDMELDADGIWQMESVFSIDEESWHPDLSGPFQAYAPTAKHAAVGDVILWEIRNKTSMAHPWHLHGFSYQPLELVRHDKEVAEHHAEQGGWEWDPDSVEDTHTRLSLDYVEFEDTTTVPAHHSLFYLVSIADPNESGGATGRWLKHCHIFQHAAGGMMSELIVEP